MRIGDWVNGAVICVVGVYLGLAVDGMTELAGTEFWPVIIIVPVLFGGAFLFVLAFDGLIDRIFPSGIKPASRQHAKQRKPLALLLCLPIGIATGVILARLGLGQALLQII